MSSLPWCSWFKFTKSFFQQIQFVVRVCVCTQVCQVSQEGAGQTKNRLGLGVEQPRIKLWLGEQNLVIKKHGGLTTLSSRADDGTRPYRRAEAGYTSLPL